MKNNDKSRVEKNVEGNYRYPGSRPFEDTEVDRCLFFGRDSDTQLLLNKTLNWGLVVLYARSGVGKTSLINAGLCQEFRNKGYVPIVVRMNNPDKEPLDTFFQGIKDFAALKKLDYEHGEEDSLWQFFRTTYFWESVDNRLKPVLILDQFEEFFISYSWEKRKTFIQDLADLLNNTVPEQLLAAIPPGQKLPYNLDEPGIKIIISIREDFLGQLEEMSQYIPSILSDRFRLMSLTREQAKIAIIEPAQKLHKDIHAAPFMFTNEAVEMMLDFLCKQSVKYDFYKEDEVEPFQLQILCRYMEDKAREKYDKMKGENEIVIGKEDLGGEKGMQKILQQYYEEQLLKLDSSVKRRRARKLFEKGLINRDDRRLSQEEGEIKRKYKLSDSLLQELINVRLLRSEPRVNSFYYELSHDTMIKPIRNSQRKHDLKRKKIGLEFFFIFILIMGWYLLTKGKDLYEKTVTLSEARELSIAQNYTDAIEKYKKLIEMYPKSVTAYLDLGDIFVKKEEYEDAINIFNKAIDNGIKHELIYFNLGNAKFKIDRPEAALDNYNKSLEYSFKLNKNAIYEAIGDVYQSQQNFAEAIEYYQKILDSDKCLPMVYMKLAVSYIKNENPDAAVEKFKEVLDIDSNNAKIYRDISNVLIERKRLDLVEKIYKLTYESKSNNSSIYLSLGDDYLKLIRENKLKKDYSRPIDCFNEAIKLSPSYGQAFYRLGNFYSEIGEDKKAIDQLEKAINLKLGPEIVSACDVLGYSYLKIGKYDDAINSYKRAIDNDPQKFSTKMNLMEAYFIAKKFAEAINLADELLNKKNDSIDSNLALRLTLIASLLFQGKKTEMKYKIYEFFEYCKSIPENYNKTWSYELIKIFLKKNNTLSPQHNAFIIKIINFIELSPKKEMLKNEITSLMKELSI